MSDKVLRFTVPAGHKAGACARKGTRFEAMEQALLFRGAQNGMGYLASCDGRMLSVLPLQADGPEQPTILPAKSVAANGKNRAVEVNGEVRSTDGKKTDVYPLPEQMGRWPALRSVFPDSAEASAGYGVLTLDVKLLAQLASAISADGKVTLLVPPANQKTGQVDKPVVAIGHGPDSEDQKGIGLIVPVHCQQKFIDHSRAYLAAHVQELPDNAVTVGPTATGMTK